MKCLNWRDNSFLQLCLLCIMFNLQRNQSILRWLQISVLGWITSNVPSRFQVTKAYLANGKDGYDCLADAKVHHAAYITGCSTVRVSTLIAHISLMTGPIIKPFHSMNVKSLRIFLVYDMSSYWLYYPTLAMTMFLTRFSQKRISAHKKCPHRIISFNALS